ncbi:hypothetical protein ACJX0J_011669, partial [Zea mays]
VRYKNLYNACTCMEYKNDPLNDVEGHLYAKPWALGTNNMITAEGDRGRKRSGSF